MSKVIGTFEAEIGFDVNVDKIETIIHPYCGSKTYMSKALATMIWGSICMKNSQHCVRVYEEDLLNASQLMEMWAGSVTRTVKEGKVNGISRVA